MSTLCRWFFQHPILVNLCLIAALPGCASIQNPPQPPSDYDVIIIGGGVGGLTAGARLSTAGLSVMLVEQHYKVGGCNTSFERGAFKFDASLHQLSMGTGRGSVRKILAQVGALQKIQLIQIPELARSIFPGVDFTMPTGVTPISAAFRQQWPAEAKNIDGFFHFAETISNEMMALSDLYRFSRFYAGLNKLFIPLLQPTLFRWRNATLKDVVDHFFSDPTLKAVIVQYWTYMGPPPSKVWAPGFIMAFYSYVKNGAWQIKGSSQALSDALAEVIIENGGAIETATLVTKINIDPHGAKGVTVDTGKTFTSRYVISNADPFQTLNKLVGEQHLSAKAKERLEHLQPSNSLAGVYLGLDVEPSFWGIETYEVFYHTSLDEDAMYEAMMAGRFDEGAVSITFYTHLNDPFYAPEGQSVLVLNTYSSMDYWPERGPEYTAKKAQMTDQLIDMAEKLLPGLREHIVVQDAMTPRTIETFTMHRDGVPYGHDLTPDQWGGFGIRTDVDRLYLVGSWANLVHGTGGAILSGHKAASLILDQEGHERP